MIDERVIVVAAAGPLCTAAVSVRPTRYRISPICHCVLTQNSLNVLYRIDEGLFHQPLVYICCVGIILLRRFEPVMTKTK